MKLRSLVRIALVAFAISIGAPSPAQAVGETASAVSIVPLESAEPRDEPSARGDVSPVRALIGAAVLIGVFVIGLMWVREQRRSGRTSKFPRIG